MSLGGIIGGAIGFFVGGPAGAKWGYAIGSALDAPAGQDYEGPRLNDLRVQTSTYGAAIPIVYGNARLAGNVIWSLPLQERKIVEESSSKGGGGGSQTTYEYYGTFAVAICDNEIAGIRKIWADSVLIYNTSDTASLETIQASNNNASGITIYYGTETQDADSLIQADKGAANTQAYRGTAYIVFDQLALEKYGNRIPSINVEVIGAGSRAMRLIESQALNGDEFAFSSIVTNWDHSNGFAYVWVGDWIATYATSGVTIKKRFISGVYEDVATFTVPMGSFSYYNPAYTFSREGVYCVYGGADVLSPEKVRIYEYNALSNTVVAGKMVSPRAGQSITDSLFVVYGQYIYCLYNGAATINTLSKLSVDAPFSWDSSSGVFGPTLIEINSESSDLSSLAHQLDIYDDRIYVLNTDYTVDIFSLAGVYIDTLTPTISPQKLMNSNAYGSNRIRIDNGLIFITNNNYIHSFDLNGGNVKYYGSTIAITGLAPYGYGGRDINNGVFHQYETTADTAQGYRTFALESLTSGSVNLSDIVSDIDARSGLEIADQDTSALTDTVNGYIITNPMPARSAIEPLQKAYFFDSAEIDNVLTYIKRGGSVVASIPQLDLGAGVEELYTHTRRQDSELPSQVLIDYSDVSRSYEVGSQRAQRINSPAENVNKLALPIVMSADYAKEIAHVLLYDAHVERDKFKLSVTNEYISLNPSDIVQFTIGSKTRRARVVAISYGKNIELDCVAEDATIYTATSTAGTSEDDSQSVNLRGATNLYLLDIPLLRNEDNSEGMYLAASGYYAGWTGSSVFKSLDSGVTYSPAADVLNSSVMGKATTVLASSNHTTFDRANSVTVRLSNGTLSSSTESLVIQGANFALLGDEIIQFVDVVDNGDDTYTLSTLLRGRRGSEAQVGTHVSGEHFALLNSSALSRVGAVINASRYYKPVTFGEPLDSTLAQVKTNTGVSLKPFSPKYITASRDGSLNLDIVWTRRSRYISSPLWNPPIFEDSESYVIEILDGVGGSVVNSYTSSSELYEYTAAQQTTDFGSTQSTVYVKIYQVSATLGNGYGTEATL